MTKLGFALLLLGIYDFLIGQTEVAHPGATGRRHGGCWGRLLHCKVISMESETAIKKPEQCIGGN